MCQCPEPLPPPNQKIKHCRLLLQGLAIGLLVQSILAGIAGDIFSIFLYLLLVYMLFLSWTQFNWCSTMVFFLFSTINTIQMIILLIGMIQHNVFFSESSDTMLSLYVLISVIYFPTAIYFSHFAYKQFKNLGMDGIGNLNFMPPGNGPNANMQERPVNADYNRMDQRIEEPASKDKKNQVFKGTAVRIG